MSRRARPRAPSGNVEHQSTHTDAIADVPVGRKWGLFAKRPIFFNTRELSIFVNSSIGKCELMKVSANPATQTCFCIYRQKLHFVRTRLETAVEF